jgi:N-acetylglucosamine-6-sulfatase
MSFMSLLITCVLFLFLTGCSPKGNLVPTATLDRAIVATESSRPNIILIVTEDQDVNTLDYMPTLQAQLIDEGVNFVNGFVSTPMCSPSRTSILTGEYAHNHQILDNAAPTGGFETFQQMGHETSTVATWLQDSGYETVLFGKYLTAYPNPDDVTYLPPGWSEWVAMWTNLTIPGVQRYYNYRLNDNGETVAYGDAAEDYSTDVLSAKMNDFIYRQTENPAPFFIYMSPWSIHHPFIPAQKYAKMFSDLTLPTPPHFNEEDMSDKPLYWQQFDDLPDATAIAALEETYRNRLRAALSIDEMIASLFDVLETTGQLENTYVFYISDNGMHMGDHRLAAKKATAYEESIRVPFIVRGPDLPSGQALEHFVLNIDLAPTLAAIAGLDVPTTVDGRSLLPLLTESPLEVEDWRQSFPVESHRNQASFSIYAVRTNPYIYIRNPEEGQNELYDLIADPYQLENIHDSADPALVNILDDQLDALLDCGGALCKEIEDVQLDFINQ